jgi:hypothetical protein
MLPWCLSGERMVIYASSHFQGGPQVAAVHLARPKLSVAPRMTELLPLLW